jgi:hypothetical protein
MTDLSGITITPGHMPAALRESLQVTVDRIGAKIVDTVRIDTTHFVCTEGRGPSWEKAVENNIPVVVPDWVKGCEREGRIVGVRGYYLNADPRLRQIGPGQAQQHQQQSQHQSQHQQQQTQERLTPQLQQVRSPPLPSPRTEVTPPTPERPTHDRSSRSESGSEDESAAPPPPPPKDDDEAKSQGKETPEPKTQTQPEEQKVRTEDLKPAAEEKGKDKEAEDSEEDDSEGSSSANAKAAKAGLPVRSKPPQATVEDEEDNGSFQEVDL